MPIVLSVNVSGLEDGVSYVLYKYNNEDLVPTSQFNYHNKWAVKYWKFIGIAGQGMIKKSRWNVISKKYYLRY
jgi:hypothetical protein